VPAPVVARLGLAATSATVVFVDELGSAAIVARLAPAATAMVVARPGLSRVATVAAAVAVALLLSPTEARVLLGRRLLGGDLVRIARQDPYLRRIGIAAGRVVFDCDTGAYGTGHLHGRGGRLQCDSGTGGPADACRARTRDTGGGFGHARTAAGK
jgi:hypothetical protein